ncbi:cell adhesion molecule CEACAM19-like [Discoglossus pictus]
MACQGRTNYRNLCLRSCVLTVLLSLTSGINIELIPQEPVVGRSVTLSVRGVTDKISSINWYRGQNPSTEKQIIGYIPGFPEPQTSGSSYIEGAEGFPNGSLLIPNLKIEYAGNYTVQIQAGKPEQASVNMPVKDMPGTKNAGLIAGIVCGVIGGIILLIFIVLILFKKFKSGNSQDYNAANKRENDREN